MPARNFLKLTHSLRQTFLSTMREYVVRIAVKFTALNSQVFNGYEINNVGYRSVCQST